jgi:hypothetical protein
MVMRKGSGYEIRVSRVTLGVWEYDVSAPTELRKVRFASGLPVDVEDVRRAGSRVAVRTAPPGSDAVTGSSRRVSGVSLGLSAPGPWPTASSGASPPL